MKTNSINNINYRAGYTHQIAAMEKHINPRTVENSLKNSKYCDWGDFKNTDLKNNKAIALANKLCAKIFINFRKIYDFRPGYSSQNHLFPKDLYVLNEQEQNSIPNFTDSGCLIKCLGLDARPIKDKPTFNIGTLLFSSEIKSLEQMNKTAESEYLDKWWSTNHYLHPFIHDWIHSSFYLTLVHRARNEGFDYKNTVKNYDIQVLTDKEKEIVSDVLGRYALSPEYGQYQEIFAEAWTKFICESLADDCVTFKKNPLDILKSTPKEFQAILEKVSKIKLYNFYGKEVK